MGVSAIPHRGLDVLSTLSQAQAGAAAWLSAARGADPWLLQVPDVGVACEVLLADRLFHDLTVAERRGLHQWIRALQTPTGAWLGHHGQPDLSLTSMGWWACVECGDDPQAEHLVRASRVVHELGGAQRANFSVRIWLAMAGAIPWAWLPSMPAELWLLPASTPVSPARIAPWARGLMTPFLLLAHGKARVHLADPGVLLLRKDGEPIAPRVTSPGFAGDLLQTFDRTLKLINKIPRGPLTSRSLGRARAWLAAAQQHHGGWFSVRPTLLTLVALRMMGMPFDDPKIRRGLDYLRSARGRVQIASGEIHLAQGLGSAPVAAYADLVASTGGSRANHRGVTDAINLLFVHEIRQAGAWQLRTDSPAGGWPHELGAQAYLDVEATCAVLDALQTVSRAGAPVGARTSDVWACIRRGCQVMLAMQESDGSFSRFERGESNVWMSRLPWRDAALLSAGERFAGERIRVTAKVLLRLNQFGWRRDDDRIDRGLQWLSARCAGGVGQFDTATVALLTRCFAAHSGRAPHPRLAACETAIRGRQHEDGSFGSPVETAAGLRALLSLSGAPCIQAERAAAALRHLDVCTTKDAPPALGTPLQYGLGLSPTCIEPYRGVVETVAALRAFTAKKNPSASSKRGER